MNRPCRRGHVGYRYGGGGCIECAKEAYEARADSMKMDHALLYPVRRERMQRVGKEYRETLDSRVASLFAGALYRAKRANLPFSLSKEWVKGRIDLGHCELTGIEFNSAILCKGREMQKRNPYAPSVDRIVPELGYTDDNCRVILWGLNAALGNWGEDVLEVIADAFLRNRKRKKLKLVA
jgi:hypothetical protein